jgi:hypothetical protein
MFSVDVFFGDSFETFGTAQHLKRRPPHEASVQRSLNWQHFSCVSRAHALMLEIVFDVTLTDTPYDDRRTCSAIDKKR